MNQNGHSIVLDCERMKYPHTGLYHFCYQLGRSLQQEPGGKDLVFYVPQKQEGSFGKDAHYLVQSPLHKFRMPSMRDYRLWHSTYQASSYFPKEKHLKMVLTIHDLNFLYDETKSAARIKRYLQQVQEKVDRADQVVAISEFTLQDIRKHLNLDRTPAKVIYNGCNIQPITELQKPAAAPDGPFLFTIGTIIAKKNFHTLPCLLDGNDYQLVISGITQRAEYKARIIAEAKQYGVADRLLFTGPVSENDKQWYLQHCDAFLFPSISEGFGLPVVEAMYFGSRCCSRSIPVYQRSAAPSLTTSTTSNPRTCSRCSRIPSPTMPNIPAAPPSASARRYSAGSIVRRIILKCTESCWGSE
jgi:glycosyltransferase involved in cell wall biosynthesis